MQPVNTYILYNDTNISATSKYWSIIPACQYVSWA